MRMRRWKTNTDRGSAKGNWEIRRGTGGISGVDSGPFTCLVFLNASALTCSVTRDSKLR